MVEIPGVLRKKTNQSTVIEENGVDGWVGGGVGGVEMEQQNTTIS